MSNWALLSPNDTEHSGFVPSLSEGVELPAFAGTNQWSAWQEIVAATQHKGASLLLNTINGAGAGRICMLEVAVGATGDEVPIFGPVRLMVLSNIASDGLSILIPVSVPAGRRISVRWRATGTATGLYRPRVSFAVVGPGDVPNGYGDASQSYGQVISATETEGTMADAGASSHTEGARVELTASTARRARGFFFNLCANDGKGWRTDYTLFIRKGPIGDEVLLTRIHARSDLRGQAVPCIAGPFFCDIPAGSRLTLSVQSFSTTANQRELGGWITLFG